MYERGVVQRVVGYFVLVVQITSVGCERRSETSPLDLLIGSLEQEIHVGSLDEAAYAFRPAAGLLRA